MEFSKKTEKIFQIYEDIDQKITGIQENSCVSCVKGCGKCCQRFEPYISTLEAIPLAQFLEKNPDREQQFHKGVEENKKEWTACPFYDHDNDNHCTIYSIRPLICRMFGFSAHQKKNKREFSSCSLIENEMPEKVKVAQRLTQSGFPVPIYQEVAKEAQKIDFDLATDYHPFSRSVEIALDMLRGKQTSQDQAEEKLKAHFTQAVRKNALSE